MFKKVFCAILVFSMLLSVVGCAKKGETLSTQGSSNTSDTSSNKEPQKPDPTKDPMYIKYKDKLQSYDGHEFQIAGLWAPYDLNDESISLYKEAGFNTLSLLNTSSEMNTDNQFYLGSNHTLQALQLCKKHNLYATLGYEEWIAMGIEGEDYYGETPFSKYDIYGEYKDIIKGIHIFDEPKKEHLDYYTTDNLINDFKKVYSNAHYIINLIPEYADATVYNYESYEGMWQYYYDNVLTKFENNRSASLDCYYFYKDRDGKRQTGIMKNYDLFAQFSKKYDVSQAFILQSSVGNEFDTALNEGDMRLQANMAIAFGADALRYYLYSVPIDTNRESGYMYENCILNTDNSPSDVYYHVQKVNNESQALADVVLSYDWQEATAMPGIANVSAVGEYYTMSEGKFLDTKHYVSVSGTQNVVMSRFTSDTHGEAYMLVNFAERELDNKVSLQMKDCTALALYGGKGFEGTPKVIELDENGKCTIDLTYGEGVFIVPIE